MAVFSKFLIGAALLTSGAFGSGGGDPKKRARRSVIKSSQSVGSNGSSPLTLKPPKTKGKNKKQAEVLWSAVAPLLNDRSIMPENGEMRALIFKVGKVFEKNTPSEIVTAMKACVAAEDVDCLKKILERASYEIFYVKPNGGAPSIVRPPPIDLMYDECRKIEIDNTIAQAARDEKLSACWVRYISAMNVLSYYINKDGTVQTTDRISQAMGYCRNSDVDDGVKTARWVMLRRLEYYLQLTRVSLKLIGIEMSADTIMMNMSKSFTGDNYKESVADLIEELTADLPTDPEYLKNLKYPEYLKKLKYLNSLLNSVNEVESRLDAPPQDETPLEETPQDERLSTEVENFQAKLIGIIDLDLSQQLVNALTIEKTALLKKNTRTRMEVLLDRASTLLKMGQTLLKMGQTGLKADDFENALSVIQNPPRSNSRAELLAKISTLQNHEHLKALREAEKAVQIRYYDGGPNRSKPEDCMEILAGLPSQLRLITDLQGTLEALCQIKKNYDAMRLKKTKSPKKTKSATKTRATTKKARPRSAPSSAKAIL